MALLRRQIWTLTVKTIRISLFRHRFATIFRSFILPVIYIVILAYARNIFIPPATFGIATSTPVRSLVNAMDAETGGRTTLVFVNSGFSGGSIDEVIASVAAPAQAAEKDVQFLTQDTDLLTTWPSSLKGVSNCFGAVVFYSSPTEGSGGIWNYTIRVDGSLGGRINVGSTSNNAEIYTIPLQHAVDFAIASLNTTVSQASLPTQVDEYMFTSMTQQQRADNIREQYMSGVVEYLAVAFMLALVGVVYQQVGLMARERELQMSQMIEAMMPNIHRWQPQAARLASYQLAFTIIYLPGWIVIALIMKFAIFSSTSVVIMLFFTILAGLALSSFAIFGAAFFKKAQLSGIIVTIATLILGIIAQVISSSAGTGTVAVLSLLFPPMNFVFFVIAVAWFEEQNLPANLLHAAPGSTSSLSNIVLLAFLILQIPAYQVLGALLERYLYGTASKGRTMSRFDEATGNSLELVNFTKEYRPNWLFGHIASIFGYRMETVTAVSGLTLTAVKGQILVLLGANGSGKTTVIDAIAGLSKATSGSIKVNDFSGIGICPQKNVLWDELTTEEHVTIFNRLKATDEIDTRKELHNLIKKCDLDRKMKARAKTLSGGQKRKLQLALMLTGGSRICCIDEVSSGLDPLSRRKIWDILLAERSKITQIFTTHYLDEADLLADHIAILSKGTLRAQGSAVSLKTEFGAGYQVFVHHRPELPLLPELDGVSRQVTVDRTIYSVPDSAAVTKLVDLLEQKGIYEYRVSGPTIEDVFLKLAEEVAPDDKSGVNVYEQRSAAMSGKTGDLVHLSEEKASAANCIKDKEAALTGKRIGFVRQAWVLFRKRFTIIQRNYLPYTAAFVVPIIAAGLVTLFLSGYTLGSCLPADSSSSPTIHSLASQNNLDLVIGPSSQFTAKDVDLLSSLLGGRPKDASSILASIHLVDNLQDFNNYINANYSSVTPGGLFLGQDGVAPLFTYVGNDGLYISTLVQNLLDTLLTNISISTQFQPFAIPLSPVTGDSLQLIAYFGLAMAAYPAFFSLYPTLERSRSVRALQYSNGVRPLPLWLAYLIFDWTIPLVSSSIAIIIFAVASSVWYHIGYLFIVFFLYAMASILLGYAISLFSRSQLASYAFTAGGQAVMFLLYLIAILSVFTYAPVQKIDSDVLYVHFTMAAVSPAGNLVRALFVALNVFQTSCNGGSLSTDPGGIELYGGPILYLILQSIALFGILLWFDTGSFLPIGLKRNAPVRDVEESETTDPEILSEIQRVSNSNDGLRVLHITKAFGSNIAVENLTFGVKSGEVFALLGPNGAGKSTVISLIRGDIRPSQGHGKIFVENISVIEHRAEARSHLGVCPQFDAMDQMTVLEHLQFYARVRGVSDVEFNAKEVVKAVGLQNFSTRMGAKLSGGNKRKLSLGIALMGNPSVLLLDEPSSGLDPASKRIMWKTLEGVSHGRSILLTTHSMEEADYLASCAGIMARHMLAIGTTDYLRHRYGDAYHVHLVTTTAPHTTREDMERIRTWIVGHFPDATLEEKTYHGQMRFSIPAHSMSSSAPGSTRPDIVGKDTSDQISPVSTSEFNAGASSRGGNISTLFKMLEENKHELGLQYYSISQTTLDQVFLKIVGDHQVEEENYGAEPKKGLWAWFLRLWK